MREFHALPKSYLIGGMKVIEEIRLSNLLALVKNSGGVTRFADKTGKQQAQISQLVNQSPDSKTKKPKSMGSSQAREFEEALGLERGWLGHEHNQQAVGELAMEAATIIAGLSSSDQVELIHYLRFEAKKKQALNALPADSGSSQQDDDAALIPQRH